MLASFGVAAEVVRLPGGQGTTFAGDGVVLKPCADDPGVDLWLAEVLRGLPVSTDLRVIRPVLSVDGQVIVDGWTAWGWLEGTEGHDWRRALEVSAHFHALVASVPWSPAVTAASNPWATGHRAGAVEELALPAQLVHADLCHNILWHPDLPPAVIDVSPWWAPPRYADAIIAVDAVSWWGAGDDAVASFLEDDEGRELLARAGVFRVVSGQEVFRTVPMRAAAERAKILDSLPLRPVRERMLAILGV